MGLVQYSIWIRARPNAVWDVYTDVGRIPQWQTGNPRVVEASGRGDEVGTTYTVRRGPGSARTLVTEAIRPSRHWSRTDANLGLSFDLTANLLPESDGTRLVLQAQTHWPKGLGVLGRVVEFALLNEREATRELQRLKVLIERDS